MLDSIRPIKRYAFFEPFTSNDGFFDYIDFNAAMSGIVFTCACFNPIGVVLAELALGAFVSAIYLGLAAFSAIFGSNEFTEAAMSLCDEFLCNYISVLRDAILFPLTLFGLGSRVTATVVDTIVNDQPASLTC